jgi:hypothetical protein
MFAIRPVVNLGSAINPFFIPFHPEDIAGPVGATALRMITAIPRLRTTTIERELESFVPSVTAVYKTFAEPEVHTIAKQPRLLGLRHPLEATMLVRPFEVRRAYYMRQLKGAIKGGQENLAQRLIREAKKEGIYLTEKDIATVKTRITKERLEEQR